MQSSTHEKTMLDLLKKTMFELCYEKTPSGPIKRLYLDFNKELDRVSIVLQETLLQL